MTATELAPASITAATFDSVIPPMATKGRLPIASRTARSPSRPTTGSGLVFVPVGKIGPIAM